MRKLILVLLCAASFALAMEDMEWEGFADIVEAVELCGNKYVAEGTNFGHRRRLIYEVHRLMMHPFFQKGKWILFQRPGPPPFLDFSPEIVIEITIEEED